MRFLLPFYDDSTLMFAVRLRAMLDAVGIEGLTLLETDKASLSERQLQDLLPEGPDMNMGSAIYTDSAIASFDAVVTSLGNREIRALLKKPGYRARSDRPAFVSFYAGLEFTPKRGFEHRTNYDIVFLNNLDHARRFRAEYAGDDWQHVSFGHPYFTMPQGFRVDDAERRDIYFFAQSISPATLEGRRFMADLLITLARRHPDRKVHLKLRHLPDENEGHLHREVFDYPWLLQRYFGELPDNLVLTACPMSEALETAGLCITCTSTAAMDSVSAGVPTMVYVDYPENYRDPLAAYMRDEFAGSRLLTSIPAMMDLVATEPDPDWLSTRFRPADFLLELKAAVEAFRTKAPVQFHREPDEFRAAAAMPFLAEDQRQDGLE